MLRFLLIIMNKKIYHLLFLHAAFFILGTILFILLFRTFFLKEMVLFYRGILFLSIATFLMAIFILILRKYIYGKILTIRDVISSVVILFCINLVFFTHIPVTADRSVSVFMLGYMNNHTDQRFNIEEMTRVFIEKFLNENNGIKKRFIEQVVSGNIHQDRERYYITQQGKNLMLFYNFIMEIFKIDKKNTTL